MTLRQQPVLLQPRPRFVERKYRTIVQTFLQLTQVVEQRHCQTDPSFGQVDGVNLPLLIESVRYERFLVLEKKTGEDVLYSLKRN